MLGVKVTLIVHDWLVGIEEHWLVAAKSPDVVAPETVMAFEPLFVMVTLCAELVDPTDWLPKGKFAGEIVAVVTAPARRKRLHCRRSKRKGCGPRR
jgi:hypothetical protein